MTGEADRLQSQMGAVQVDFGIKQPLLVGDILLLMAACASQRRMLASQFVTGEPVVKPLFSLLPVDQSEGPALMFDMTLLTPSMFFLRMQSFLRRYPFGKHRMAVKTFGSANLLTRIMAFGAIFEAFKRRMRLVQFTWR